VLDGAAQWLLDRGIEQWPVPFPRHVIERDLARSAAWLAVRGPRVVGTVTVLDEDPMFWGDQPPDAWYVHRLAIRRDAVGDGAGILEWVEREAAANGKTFVRLDCGPALRSYYERAGYEHCWDFGLRAGISAPDGWVGSCLEKSLAP
jgi:hypothetical protein